jgi:hypothetical protein
MRLADPCHFNAIHPVMSLTVRVTELIVATALLTVSIDFSDYTRRLVIVLRLSNITKFKYLQLLN